jgi:hypothetical protein
MEERKRILKMLEEGKINAKEAEELLESIESKKEKTLKPKTRGKKLKIQVDSEDGDKVNISIPLSLARIMSSFIPKSQGNSLKEKGIDIETILNHIDELEDIDEDIVNIEAEGEKVRIYIE